MEFKKLMVTLALAFAVTMAVADQSALPVTTTRVSRFLQGSNPRAGNHCPKNGESCSGASFFTTSFCCSNKCVSLATDNNNCGGCKKKCKYTEVCCRGECVNIAFDKRHCGTCDHRCLPGYFCVYGMCNYA